MITEMITVYAYIMLFYGVMFAMVFVGRGIKNVWR